MGTGDDYVDFLQRHGALDLGQSPWPDARRMNDVDVLPLDWTRLYPRQRPNWDGEPWDLFGDEWNPDLDELAAELESGSLPADGGRNLDPVDPATSGWDVCAWYQPMHHHGRDWGIFILEECVLAEARRIARFLPAHTGHRSPFMLAKALVRAATYQFFLHEILHHRVESLAIRLHVLEGRERYRPYNKRVYRPTLMTDDNLEEALANANAHQRIGQQPYGRWITPVICDATRRYLSWRFSNDPPGYRRASDHLGRTDWEHGLWSLGTQVREAKTSPLQAPEEFGLATGVSKALFNVTSAIWVVVPRGTTPRLPVRSP